MRVSVPTGSIKFILGWIFVFLFRLIPFRPPNVEPMLATVMPFSKRYGYTGSFLFGFLGIVLYDAITSGWGLWTLITALSYGLLGVWARHYFRKRDASRGNFVAFGIFGTLAYDAITMMIAPIFYGQSIAVALVGQVPFTIMHLLGTVVFAAFLSPIIHTWIVQNESFEMTLAKRAV